MEIPVDLVGKQNKTINAKHDGKSLIKGNEKYGVVIIYIIVFNLFLGKLNEFIRAQRLIKLEIPVLVQSLKSKNVELGSYLDERLFKCCLSVATNP